MTEEEKREQPFHSKMNIEDVIWCYRGLGKGCIPLLPGMSYKEPTDDANKRNDCKIPEFLKRQNPEPLHRHRSLFFAFIRKIFQRAG